MSKGDKEKMQWKEVQGFNNYEVSTNGDIRNKKTGSLLKQKTRRDGYLEVVLCNNGKRATKKVHRLVAEAFIPNPANKSDVNHINEKPGDNRSSNLNWLTHQENLNYGTHNEKMALTQSTAIYALYPDGTDEYYQSTHAAARELGLWRQNIISVLKGRNKTCGGLRFEYAE